MTIHFRCPHCGTVTNVSDEFAGMQGPCAGCGAKIAIPKASETAGAWNTRQAPARHRTSFPLQLVGALGCTALLGLVIFVVMNSRLTRPLEKQCRNNLKEIYLALQAYQTDAGCLPPRVIYDDQGQALHSWRVLLLPYVGGDHLVERYRFDEPWNSEHNRKLADEMPSIYSCAASPEHLRYHTSYVAVVADGLTFAGMRQTPDGSPDVAALIVVEIAPSEVHWMAPEDMAAAELQSPVNEPPAGGVSSFHPDKAFALAADGTIHTLSAGESAATPPPH